MRPVNTNTSWTVIVLLAAAVTAGARAADPIPETKPLNLKQFKVDRALSEEAQRCIECHTNQNPGMVADWAESRHAHINVTCIDCHLAKETDKDASKIHEMFDTTPVSAIVSPKDCSRCHPSEAAEYNRSKHAQTLPIIWEIDPWMKDGMNNSTERTTGCYHCHGSVVKIEGGVFDSATWPNVGVGRINPDGSRGSCSSCHTRHKFSLAEARKPEACGQCHLGPDHPQIEIYNESKHGAIYAAEGDQWKWDSPPGIWAPGVDYRAPTCSVCHMSGIGGVATTHDVTERLAWETQAPLTIRPSEFKPLPAKTDWKTQREKMENVCLACHSPTWTKGHFDHFDEAVENYNETYYKPMKKRMDALYEKGLLSKDKNLDEKLEYEMYELWHHEGRRARFGAAMMAPDYAWWHGFYELKKRCLEMDEQITELEESGKPARVHDIRGATGDTTKPEKLD